MIDLKEKLLMEEPSAGGTQGHTVIAEQPDRHVPSRENEPSAKTEPDLPVFGPIMTCGPIDCCDIKLCGCTVCARKDKVMVLVLTVCIVLLVLALVVSILAEVSALARAGAEVENVVVATKNWIKVFQTMFAFLGYGTLTMIGKVGHRPRYYREA